MHQHSAVTIDAPHLGFGLLQGHAKGNAAAVAHGAYGQKVTGMGFACSRANLKQFAAGLAGGAHNGVIARNSGDAANDLLAL